MEGWLPPLLPRDLDGLPYPQGKGYFLFFFFLQNDRNGSGNDYLILYPVNLGVLVLHHENC